MDDRLSVDWRTFEYSWRRRLTRRSGLRITLDAGWVDYCSRISTLAVHNQSLYPSASLMAPQAGRWSHQSSRGYASFVCRMLITGTTMFWWLVSVGQMGETSKSKNVVRRETHRDGDDRCNLCVAESNLGEERTTPCVPRAPPSLPRRDELPCLKEFHDSHREVCRL